MRSRRETYGLAALGFGVGFLVVLMGTVGLFRAEPAVAVPIAAAVGVVGAVGTYAWLRATTKTPDPLLG